MGLLIQWLATFVGGFVIAFITEWRLTLLLLAFAPFMVIAGFLDTKVCVCGGGGGWRSRRRNPRVVAPLVTYVGDDPRMGSPPRNLCGGSLEWGAPLVTYVGDPRMWVGSHN